MRVLGWIAPGTWQAVVEAARRRPESDEITLVAAVDSEEALPTSMLEGLMGRNRRGDHHCETSNRLTSQAAEELLGRATQALGRTCETRLLTGRTERVVTTACDDADLLLLSRDGTVPGWGQQAWAITPASCWTTRPAPSPCSGPARRPRWTPSPPRPTEAAHQNRKSAPDQEVRGAAVGRVKPPRRSGPRPCGWTSRRGRPQPPGRRNRAPRAPTSWRRRPGSSR